MNHVLCIKNMKYIKKSLFILTTCYLLHATLIPLAKAEEVSLSTSPALVRVAAKPGVTVEVPITVENLSSSPTTLGISYRQFTAADTDDGLVTYIPTDPNEEKVLRGTSVWENDSPIPSVVLAAKQKKIVKLHTVLLPDTPNRDYYFSIILSTEAASLPGANIENSSTYLQVHTAIATNILLSVGDAGKPELALGEFSSPAFVQHGPIAFLVQFKNNGQQLARPEGTITITNIFGQKIGKVSIDTVNVLAKSGRFLSAKDYKSKSANGSLVPAVLWDERFLLGPYTATLEISNPDTSEKVAKTIHFFALPYNRLGAIFFVGMIITVIILKVRKRLNG
jgi:hypothetical protein